MRFILRSRAVYNDGVVTGCRNLALLYCPTLPSTRAEMAAYLLRAKHGGTYQPPAPDRFFSDVGRSDPYLAWIDELYREHITTGCPASPLRYCPTPTVPRGQMAAFINATFPAP